MKDVTVIVQLSGSLTVPLTEDTTPEDLFSLVGDHWGVDLEKIDKPFVVVHDQLQAKYRPVDGDAVLGKVNEEREIVRVVLPLR